MCFHLKYSLVNCLGGCDLDFLNVIDVHPISNSGSKALYFLLLVVHIVCFFFENLFHVYFIFYVILVWHYTFGVVSDFNVTEALIEIL